MPTGISSGNPSFVGEHTYYTRSGQRIHFAWITNSGNLASLTRILSHEIVESATDPEGSAFLGVAGTCSQGDWCEIGDVCSSTSVLDGVTVQSYWSNQAERLVIDEANVENACMRYIPGSHQLGHLTYTLSENDEANVLNQTVAGAETLGEPVNVELKAGEISIQSDLLLHGSEANQSSKRRCGLTLRYCPTIVRTDLGWNAKGVVVSGKPHMHSLNQQRAHLRLAVEPLNASWLGRLKGAPLSTVR